MSKYVAIEGIDGAGKSTVARSLAAHFEEKGHTVTVVREPGGTPAGEEIREILLESATPLDPWTEAMLFAAARAQLAATVVAPALAEGHLVVSDRTYYSSLAYQGGARGLGVEKVRAVNEAGLRGVVPDFVVLLRLDAADGLARESNSDRISGEGLELQQAVAETYDRLAAEAPDRFVVVDARRPLESLVVEIAEELESRW